MVKTGRKLSVRPMIKTGRKSNTFTGLLSAGPMLRLSSSLMNDLFPDGFLRCSIPFPFHDWRHSLSVSVAVPGLAPSALTFT